MIEISEGKTKVFAMNEVSIQCLDLTELASLTHSWIYVMFIKSSFKIKQLLDLVFHDIKKNQCLGYKCHFSLDYSWYHVKTSSNNCLLDYQRNYI